jgi:soluble lytic murein transglycosylase-like protein
LPDGPDWRWLKAQGVQESGLDPSLCSEVGACGVMQVMPATWQEIERAMGWRNVSPFSARHNIFGGAWYQARMDRIWQGRGRSLAERHALGLGSYNAGPGSILAAQERCDDAWLWPEIASCLPAITGPANARQTIDYVQGVARLRAMMPRD